MSISQVTIPYSWFNVSPQWQNQQIIFGWPSGGSVTNTTLDIPTGFYSTSDLNSWLMQEQISLGAYLINPSGQYVFYASIVQNQTYYANQLIFSLIPTSLPSGWSQPTGFAGYPTVSQTPRLVFPVSNSIGSNLGFTAGAYGTYTVATSILSNQTPIATNVNSLILHCNLASNPITMPSDILDSIPIENVQFGSNINFSPSFQRWISIIDGTYNSLILTLTDENNTPIVAQDNNSLITLVLETD